VPNEARRRGDMTPLQTVSLPPSVSPLRAEPPPPLFRHHAKSRPVLRRGGKVKDTHGGTEQFDARDAIEPTGQPATAAGECLLCPPSTSAHPSLAGSVAR
jgi:hypothetical protein